MSLLGTEKSAKEIAYEAGYRAQVSPAVSIDLAVFENRYDDLIGVTGMGNIARFVPGQPFGIAELPFVNNFSAHSRGGEASITAVLAEGWRVTASVSQIDIHLHGSDFQAAVDPNLTPKNQVTLRSSTDIGRSASLDIDLRHVSAIEGVPAYETLDFRFAWRLSDNFELSLVGHNLLDPLHPEQESIPVTVASEIPREFFGRLTCRF